MFGIGETAYDKEKKRRVRILKRCEAWGYISYQVYDPAAGCVYSVTEEQLSSTQEERQPDENFLRYMVQLAGIRNQISAGYLASLTENVIPLPHQIHVLNRVLSGSRIRYILADEVGLGKTIEAGMVIRELKSRGLVRRVLVVCPTGLVNQWAMEMQEKFQEKFTVIVPSDYEAIRRLTGKEDVYGSFDQVISPMDAVKPVEKRAGWSDERVEQYNKERIYSIIDSGWDLIIIDEAHRVAGSSGEVARYKLGKLLSQASPYLLLLTATPHNGRTEPFLRLVRLLDSSAFPDAKSIVRKQVAPYLIRTEKREAIDNQGNLLFKKRVTHLITLAWGEQNSRQKDLYQMVSAYVSKAYQKARRSRKKNMCLIFLLIMMQRMVTSSTAAILQSLERRLRFLTERRTNEGTLTEQDLYELDFEDGPEEVLGTGSYNVQEEIEELRSLLETARQARMQSRDVKEEPLLDLIDGILAEDPTEKIIVFTEFRATQDYLREVLTAHGLAVTVLNGQMNLTERAAALESFRDQCSVFVSTDAGGEGINLQFANIVVNYDLPWNPMKIEQRIGRADRIGQKRDVHVYNFILSDTVENRVRQVLEDKLSAILQEMGVDKYSDVLDSEAAGREFTDAYLDSIGYPGGIEKRLSPVENELKQQMENVKNSQEIIREEKDLQAYVGTQPDFDADAALQAMMKYYGLWQGNGELLHSRYKLADEQIAWHLKTEWSQDQDAPLLCVGIDEFPNEAGFFLLWHLAVSAEDTEQRILPVFVNEKMILRPMAGERLMKVFLDKNSRLSVRLGEKLSPEKYKELEKLSLGFAADLFEELKDKHLKRNEESYEKYRYAQKLRTESAMQIGIENIRKGRLEKLKKEEAASKEAYQNGKKIFPEFRLLMLVRLEA